MRRNHLSTAVFASLVAAILVLASCQADQSASTPASTPAPPRMQSSVTTQPGVAGGVSEDVLTVDSIVSAVDLPTRLVTLTSSDGSQFTFVAGPEIKNLPQLHVGDKVTATFARRIVILVRSNDATPYTSYASANGSALPGEKPGALFADETEVVATVKSIDSVSHTAVLEYSGGSTRKIPVRADVDLSRYKVGDSVLTRVTTALTVLVTTPK